MDWLDEHMRKHLAETPGENNVLTLRLQPSLIEEVGARTVELVERAIQHIQNVEEEAAATHARAETLARNALERLKLGEERVRAAESARQAAEARIEETTAKLRDMEIQLERTAANAAAAEERARDAERRATEAENALKRIETLVQTLMLEKRLSTGGVTA